MMLWQLQEMIRVLGPDFRVRFLERNGRKVTSSYALGHSGLGASSTNTRTLQGVSTAVGGHKDSSDPIWRH